MTAQTPALRNGVGPGVLLAAALLLTGCGLLDSGPERNDAGRVTEPVDAAVLDLREGDCFTDDGGPEVTLMPCDKPHEYEVFAATDLPDDEYPGADQAEATADDFCRPAFEEFVGVAYNDSELPMQYFYPTAEDWSEAGNRTILCLVAQPGGEHFTDSLENVGR